MGVIKDGYYYPDAQEITLGYICQVNWGRGYTEVFEKYSPKLKEEDGAYTDELHDLLIAIDDGYAEIRVPLLSKEDIESLGWVSKDVGYNLGGWGLVKGSTYISISSLASGGYNGPCLTINELKYLMNLLKIPINGK